MLRGGSKHFLFSPRTLGRWSNMTWAYWFNQPPTRMLSRNSADFSNTSHESVPPPSIFLKNNFPHLMDEPGSESTEPNHSLNLAIHQTKQPSRPSWLLVVCFSQVKSWRTWNRPSTLSLLDANRELQIQYSQHVKMMFRMATTSVVNG